jgi:4-diphosphocytidyl-2-C-methyl-D-erythritol kinase
MRAARVLAQAKLNVWLHVLGPRPDGFHELRTLFHRLDLADEVTIRVSDGPSRAIDVSGPHVPPEGLGPATNNLAYRAAVSFHARTGWPRGFEIHVTKNIPVGGGLGGGSADAGAILRALNVMAPEPLENEALQAVAASLGSDVPFLASEYTAALGDGRGESLSQGFLALPPADVLLVVPGYSIATADAYRWLRESGRYHRLPQESSGELQPYPSIWAAMDEGNTFEPIVEPRYPGLRLYRERLTQAGATIARLSGSGSTVFGLFESTVPDAGSLRLDASVIATRTAKNVVQVEAQE